MMYKTNIILTTLLLLASCVKHPSNNTIEKQLDSAESIMLSTPDSALSIIESIDIDSIQSIELRARHALLHSQALDKNYIDLTTDSIINPAVEFYSQHGNDRERGMTYYYLSRIYDNNNEIEKAIETAVKAKYALEKTDDDNMKGLLYAHLGDLYIDQYNFTTCLKMYQQAIRHYQKANNQKNIAYTLLSKSNIYDYLKDADSALNEIKKADSIATIINDTAALYEVKFYLATLYANSYSKCNEAKDIIFNGLSSYNQTPDKHDFFLLSNIYNQLGQYDSALYYLNLCPETADLNIHDKEKYYAQKSLIYNNSGDYKTAYNNFCLYTEIALDSKVLQQNKSIKELEQKYHTQLIEQSYRQLHTQHVALCIISILLLALIILLVLIFRKQKRERINRFYTFHETAKANYKSLQEQCETLKQELKTKEEQSILYTKAIDKRMEDLQKLLEMTDIYENQADMFYLKCREYMKLCNEGTQSILNDLQSITTIYFGDFIGYLHEHYPTLNSDEINLCCMISLNFTTQHIRILFNHTNGKSIYTKRSKLRSKLHIPDTEDLDLFIKNIAESTRRSESQTFTNQE